MNDDIRIREVRLIDEDGTQVGVVPTAKALELAQERGLDLVEVSPDASPPVAKILDYGKFKYAQNRKQDGRKRSRAGTVKEVRFRPRTDQHDIEFLVRRLEKFLLQFGSCRSNRYWDRSRICLLSVFIGS